MKDIIKKMLEEKEENYGAEDGAILMDQAHHGCAPDLDHGWCAQAIKDNHDGTFDIGEVWWDFASWVEENGGVPDDDGNYPWEGTGEFYPESEGLTIEDDFSQILYWLE